MFSRNKKPKTIKIARAISYLFDGSVLALPLFVAVSFYKYNNNLYNYSNKNLSGVMTSFFTSIVFTALIPYILILFLYRSGKISDLQMPKRKERLFPLLIINISVIIGFCVLIFTSPTRLLLSVYSMYLLSLPVISLITFFWKISFHSSYITLFSIAYMLVFGKWAILTLPLIPIVGWSRIKLKKHTIAQVLAGAAITAAASFSVLYITGFLNTDYWAVYEVMELLKNTSSYLNLILPGFGVCLLFLALYTFLYMYTRNKSSRERYYR